MTSRFNCASEAHGEGAARRSRTIKSGSNCFGCRGLPCVIYSNMGMWNVEGGGSGFNFGE